MLETFWQFRQDSWGFSKHGSEEEDREVDPESGYPLGPPGALPYPYWGIDQVQWHQQGVEVVASEARFRS